VKTIPYSWCAKLLRELGLVHIRTSGSHQIWNYPTGAGRALLRPVIIREKDKDIPVAHLMTNLHTLVESEVLTEAGFAQMLEDLQNPKAARARKRREEADGTEEA
jgi:predicted RNA binding protein YcfA (HicA-like mRNA interferase family)